MEKSRPQPVSGEGIYPFESRDEFELRQLKSRLNNNPDSGILVKKKREIEERLNAEDIVVFQE